MTIRIAAVLLLLLAACGPATVGDLQCPTRAVCSADGSLFDDEPGCDAYCTREFHQGCGCEK
jgi:hypothetical protein